MLADSDDSSCHEELLGPDGPAAAAGAGAGAGAGLTDLGAKRGADSEARSGVEACGHAAKMARGGDGTYDTTSARAAA